MSLFDNIQDEVLLQMLQALLSLAVIFLVIHLAQRLARRLLDDPNRLYRTKRTIRGTGFFIALLLLVITFHPELGDFLTLLTVIGAGLAIALREMLLSVVGWMRNKLMSSFKHGDRIEINGIHGDVIDIRVLRTTVMEIRGWVNADQSTGRIVHIPNGWIFGHALYNYTGGFRFIWNELPVVVTFRSNWQAAHDILLELAQISAHIVEQQAASEIHQMSGEYLIHYSILTPFVYVRLVDNGIQLTLRYLCEARKRRGTEHAITISALDAFKRHGDIELAYPMVGVWRGEAPVFAPPPWAQPAQPGTGTPAEGQNDLPR